MEIFMAVTGERLSELEIKWKDGGLLCCFGQRRLAWPIYNRI